MEISTDDSMCFEYVWISNIAGFWGAIIINKIWHLLNEKTTVDPWHKTDMVFYQAQQCCVHLRATLSDKPTLLIYIDVQLETIALYILIFTNISYCNSSLSITVYTETIDFFYAAALRSGTYL